METGKNRKRGIRIAQKSTYKHHSADNSPYYRRTQRNCWNCEGFFDETCSTCIRYLNRKDDPFPYDYEYEPYRKKSRGGWMMRYKRR